MPTSTYIPLANLTLTSSASTVTFSSISGAYRDLIFIVSNKNTVGTTGLRYRINSDTGANYYYVIMEGNGSTATSGINNLTEMVAGPSSLSDSQQIIQIMDYSATDKHKPILERIDFPSAYVDAIAGRWASTSAVTSVQFYPAANAFAAGSTFALYGISA